MIEKHKLEFDITALLKWHNDNLRYNPKGRINPTSQSYREIGAQYTVPEWEATERLFAFIKQYGDPTDVWINYNPPGARNKEHHHVNSDIAGCWYITVPPDSGQLVFETGERFYPEPFDLYLWDARRVHSVTTNLSTEPRLSIAFNIKRK